MANRDTIDRHLGIHEHVYRDRAFIYDECFYMDYVNSKDAYEGGCRVGNVGANSGVVRLAPEDTTTYGILNCKTGSEGAAAGARAGIRAAGMPYGLTTTSMTIKFECRIRIPTAATNAEDFTVICGLTDDQNSHTPNGIYIKFTLNAQSQVEGITRTAGSQNAPVIVPNKTEQTSWHTYGFVYKYGAGARFYYDGKSADGWLKNTNIDTGDLGIQPVFIKKNNGTTSRSAYIDWYWYEFIPDTSR